MENILCIVGVILFYIFGLVVVNISGQDIHNMMRMSKFEFYVTIPISIILWIYESFKMKNWSICADKYSSILICFLLFNIIIVWFSCAIYNRKTRKKILPFNMKYYKDSNDYNSPENATFRVLTFSFTTIVAATIYIAYSIIK